MISDFKQVLKNSAVAGIGNILGKAATWLLYAGVGFLIVTHRSTHWPYWIFWTGLALAVLSGLVYAAGAWREVRR